MQKVHDPSKNRKWVDYPDIESPIIADELNRHETELDEIDSRVVVHETTKANQVDLLTCVASITLNTTTGILTITLKNGSSTTIDTGLSKLAVNFDYDADPTSPHYEQLILEMADGTYKYIDLSALITQFEFVNSATITWTVGNDGKVTANIINGSITEEMLETNFLANCRLEVNKALGFSQDAEAWAKGTKGGTPVASTDEHYHNNSKYYSEESQASSEDSEAWAKGTRNGVDVPSTDETYENNAKYWAEQARSIVGDKVDSFNGRKGVVVPQAHDYSGNQVDYDNTTSGAVATNVQGAIDEAFAGIATKQDIIPFNTFPVLSANWTANSDTSTSTDYPYVYTISSAIYSNASTPVWDLAGAGAIPTSIERESIDMILEAVFSTSGITLYATDEPTSNLTLRVKGK